VDLSSTSTQAIPIASQSVIHPTAQVSRSRGHSSYFQKAQIKTPRSNRQGLTYRARRAGRWSPSFLSFIESNSGIIGCLHTLSTGKAFRYSYFLSISFLYSTVPGARDVKAARTFIRVVTISLVRRRTINPQIAICMQNTEIGETLRSSEVWSPGPTWGASTALAGRLPTARIATNEY
jgi:hypothetical protein